MFQKPFRVKSQTAMKGSDRKKLRVDIEQQFPRMSSAQVADLIPNKGDMTLAKIVTRSEETLQVYCYQKNPVFFESFKKLYPTVYTLWKYPDMLPGFITYPVVIDKMRNGADLMLPGVVVKGEPHPKMFGDLQKDDLCLVRARGNRAPFVLGRALKSGEDLYHSALKGKAVATLHCFLDHLWEMGDKSYPPEIPDGEADDSSDNEENAGVDESGTPETDEVSQPMVQLGVQDKENGGVAMAGAAGIDVNGDATGDLGDGDGEDEDAGGMNAENQESPEEIDSLLQHCFKCAIKGRVSKSDLPLLTSSLLKGYMQPFCGGGRHLDVKKSSYKKFSKFLKQMEAEGFIKLKEMSKGVDAITEIDRSHPELRGWTVPEVVAVDEPVEVADEQRFEPPDIQEVLCVTSAVLPLLSSKGYSRGSALTAADLRQAVTDYVKANNLQSSVSKEHVILDPILAHLVLTRDEGDQPCLPWPTLFARITDKMQPGCVIQMAGRAPVLKKGKLDPVKLDVEQRGSKKKVTIVQNLEAYGVDARQFGQMVQRKVAGSASVIQSEQKNRGAEVHVQGNQIDFIARVLLETYKIPRKYIQGAEKAVKSKRK